MTDKYDNRATSHNLKADPNQPRRYQIKVEGHLGTQWTEWFDGLVIQWDDKGNTLLTGLVTDQAALYGLLKKVRDLGMPLLAVNCIESSETDVSL